MRGLFYFPTRRLLLSLHVIINPWMKFVSPEEVESINAFRNVKELAEILKNKK